MWGTDPIRPRPRHRLQLSNEIAHRFVVAERGEFWGTEPFEERSERRLCRLFSGAVAIDPHGSGEGHRSAENQSLGRSQAP
jgi:hypothetical protein